MRWYNADNIVRMEFLLSLPFACWNRALKIGCDMVYGVELLILLDRNVEQIIFCLVHSFNPYLRDLPYLKPGGIIALLDETCMFPKSTHETFAQKLYQTFMTHKRFVKPKLARTEFTLVHYAGEVQYQCDLFLDKNKDYVVPEHQEMLSTSKCSFVTTLFPPLNEDTPKPGKFSSIGSRFKQLRSGGVLEAIRVKCEGYPTNRTFSEFITRFAILAPEVLDGIVEENVACKSIMEKMGLSGYQIGKTKIFLKAGQMAELDAVKGKVLGESAKAIQKKVRSCLSRKQYLDIRTATVFIQAVVRGILACESLIFRKKIASAVKIQKSFRRRDASKKYMDIRSSAIILQTGVRAMVARNEFETRKQKHAAAIIQASKEEEKDDGKEEEKDSGKAEEDSGKAEEEEKKEEEEEEKAEEEEKKVEKKEEEEKKEEKALEEEKKEVKAEEEVKKEVKSEEEEEKAEEEEKKEEKAEEEEKKVEKAEEEEKKEENAEEEVKKEEKAEEEEKKEENAEEEEKKEEKAVEEVKKEEKEVHELQNKEPEKQSTVDVHEKAEILDSPPFERNEGKKINVSPDEEPEIAEKEIESCPIVVERSISIQDALKAENLPSEVEKLKALLMEERRRADEYEKKHAEAQELSELRRKKLEETEKKVCQLQDSLNRLVFGMSEQFSQLKTFLQTSSNSISASASPPIARVDYFDNLENSDDASSNGSDFAFRASGLTSANNSSHPAKAPHVLVKDATTTDITGWPLFLDANAGTADSDKEGAFDDYF
ncbi:hypothetical protein F3Y22_tig00110356pilonHSYRG00160 [Hibiscus syriacus]|uniref:Myosin motor domain-containing protein n=1 Tax=Hibiscus syriacus TaxID=106335 RepID=A0A6A3AWF0_HIBSY|nr:hypothetical protein F3Y22_tig00110356pilonHSYRG00160 [Hibiscus syriacus]